MMKNELGQGIIKGGNPGPAQPGAGIINGGKLSPTPLRSNHMIKSAISACTMSVPETRATVGIILVANDGDI